LPRQGLRAPFSGQGLNDPLRQRCALAQAIVKGG